MAIQVGIFNSLLSEPDDGPLDTVVIYNSVTKLAPRISKDAGRKIDKVRRKNSPRTSA